MRIEIQKPAENGPPEMCQALQGIRVIVSEKAEVNGYITHLGGQRFHVFHIRGADLDLALRKRNQDQAATYWQGISHWFSVGHDFCTSN